MNDFGKIIGNTVLNLFLGEQIDGKQNLRSNFAKNSTYINRLLKNEDLRVTVYLTPKSTYITQNCEVLILDVSHRTKEDGQLFQSFEYILNNDKAILADNLDFLIKFVVCCCSVSPYLNFNSKKLSETMEFLRRKFLLNYSVEFKAPHEMVKSSNCGESQSAHVYNFNKKLENSQEQLNITLQVKNDVEQLIVVLRNNEMRLARNKSLKIVRNRFLSDENRDGILDPDFCCKKKGTRHQSSSNIEVPGEGINKFERLEHHEIPFIIIGETFSDDNIHEYSLEGENKSNSPIQPEDELDIKQIANSSSHYTSTNFSIRSRPREPVDVLNFDHFGNSPALENLYYIINRTKLAFNSGFTSAYTAESYSSESNLVKPADFESNKSLSKKVIISFYNR